MSHGPEDRRAAIIVGAVVIAATVTLFWTPVIIRAAYHAIVGA